jgi:hypothetical protein
MIKQIPIKIFIAFVGFLLIPVIVCSAEKPEPPTFENSQIRLRVIPRTPDQMSGFYAARGFPKAMVDLLANYCFFTVGLRNKSPDVVWLELANWQFMAGDTENVRQHRKQWPPLWKKMHIPMASQSTFRWTLLPEVLDFQPDEAEGGNVVLSRTDNPFTLKARFAVGKNKTGKPIQAQIDNLRCAVNEE